MSTEGLRQDLDALFTQLKAFALSLCSVPDADPGTSAEAARLVRQINKMRVRAWLREGWPVPDHIEASVKRRPRVTCCAVTQYGKPCERFADRGSKLCFSHDPTKAAAREEQAAKIGEANREAWRHRKEGPL